MQTQPVGGGGDQGVNNATCSLDVAVPQGQQFVLLTQQWSAFTYSWTNPGRPTPPSFQVTVSASTGTGAPQQIYSGGQSAAYAFTAGGGSVLPPPTPPWTLDGELGGGVNFYHLDSVVALPVSPLTQQRGITLTLQLQILVTGNPERDVPLSVVLGLYGGTGLKLTQTEAAFRPRDARDAAAQCGQYPGDCHPQFKAVLTGLGQFISAPIMMWQSGPVYVPDALLSPTIDFTLTAANPLAAAGTWLQGTSTNYGADLSTDPDYVFEPGPQTAANLTVLSPSHMQTQPGTVTLAQTESDPYGGAPPTPPATPAVTIPITVTSHDFGGKAYLRATLKLAPGMPPLDAEIVDPATLLVNSDGTVIAVDVVPPVDNKPANQPVNGTCGTDFAAHPFASLPVDQDCNGIADSWEGQYTNPPGGHLDPMADNEPGYTPTSPKGDGWSVHDEYRGFHYVADDGVTAQWASTDPVKTFDVFFWDAGFTPNQKTQKNMPADPSVYTKALRTILCLQGSAAEMGTTFKAPRALGIPDNPAPISLDSMAGYHYCYGNATTALQPGAFPTLSQPPVGVNEYDPTIGNPSQPNPLRFWYRRVNATQANAVSSTRPASGVSWFNKNSITSASKGGDHTVVIYSTEIIGPGKLGGTTNNLGICPDCLGGDPTKYRIGLDYGQIVQLAQKFARRGTTTVSPDIWLAQAVAHETGHWFQQNHSQRQGCCTFAVGGRASGLDWFHFTFNGNNPSSDILIGLEQYPNRSRQNTPRDRVACSTVGSTVTETAVRNVSPPMVVYKVGTSKDFDPTPDPPMDYGSTLFVLNLQYELMDWTPNLTLANPTQWHFDPANLKALCAKNPCPPEDSGANLCQPAN
jgi:hypothetical protein